MKIFKLLLLTAFTLTLIIILNHTFVLGSMPPIPPMGKLLDPVNGFWANAEGEIPSMKSAIQSENLKGEVTVRYDERWVPHIFAGDARDAYFAQGYVTASNRLFQMELQTHLAAGRVSEILYHQLGEKVLKNDRYMRRLGLKRAAEKSLAEFQDDPEAKMIISAYTEGVNAYIESLSYRDYPVEYKLLDHEPEKWTELKCALLLKYMAHMLTGESSDIAMTNELNKYGADFMNLFYPDFPSDMTDPIVPSGTVFEKDSALIPKPAPAIDSVPEVAVTKLPFEKFPDGYGSNNWAVSGKKTKSGSPILCNDPHLGLNTPAIWFEMQITTPEYNVYGVSLPGAPAIIIGFNDYISWGVTNGTRDVRDWYKVKFKDETRKEYWVDGKWEQSVFYKDTFYLRNESEPFIDEVVQTKFGTVIYDKSLIGNKSAENLASSWTAEEPSNELYTFVKLNRARNYDEYAEALSYFNCPAQNFVFASKEGDVAIWQQGALYAHQKGQGKYIQDGTNSANIWKDKVDWHYTPHVKNPERGFVSSANQHPTDSLYPYYYNGTFEYYRNRRINAELTRLANITAQDMMKLQNDNYNLIAAEALPYMLSNLGNVSHTDYKNQLQRWNYFNNAELFEPVIFQAWWNEMVSMMFEELLIDNLDNEIPQQYNIIRVMQKYPDHAIFDYALTPNKKENVRDIINMSFEGACKGIDSLKANIKDPNMALTWSRYKGTAVQHLLKLKPFGRYNLPIGGGKNIVNACDNNWGPSWRMIVSLEKETKAFAVYPGGQSGNPGSRFYNNFIDQWAAGKYYELWIMKSETEEKKPVLFTQKFFK